MSAALAGTCDALQLKNARRSCHKVRCEKVIRLAQRGIRDVATLRRMTLEEFGIEEVKTTECNATYLTQHY